MKGKGCIFSGQIKVKDNSVLYLKMSLIASTLTPFCGFYACLSESFLFLSTPSPLNFPPKIRHTACIIITLQVL